MVEFQGGFYEPVEAGNHWNRDAGEVEMAQGGRGDFVRSEGGRSNRHQFFIVAVPFFLLYFSPCR